jgi:hypothetical protein
VTVDLDGTTHQPATGLVLAHEIGHVLGMPAIPVICMHVLGHLKCNKSLGSIEILKTCDEKRKPEGKILHATVPLTFNPKPDDYFFYTIQQISYKLQKAVEKVAVGLNGLIKVYPTIPLLASSKVTSLSL